MAKSKKMGGLGRGLDAILPENSEEKENSGVTVVR